MQQTRLSILTFFIVYLLLGLARATSVEVEIERGTMSASSQTPPPSFPQLKGMDGEEAKKTIEKQFPSLSVLLVPEDSMVTMDYREDRVRIFVDPNGKVATVPLLG
ncbi:Potato inhibitor I family protein [Nitzschia inconspicua]|uniref:Potato inhibitor I family protein n=1 Tax=Nitzschia inconspicua TaxID=303405 RepID=A0A9K3LCH8_9STRA|nr:Potato inhibitor I family protein [Nitzschia inconspicua]